MRFDPHNNVFYFYRGSSFRDGDDAYYDRQLENNTTKALANLFSHDDSGIFLRALLSDVSRRADCGKLAIFQPRVSLQAGMERSVPPATRIVLSLIPPTDKIAGDSVGGRPDAVIYDVKGGWAMLVESKLYGKVSASQISGHIRGYGWPDSRQIEISWHQIFDLISSVSEASLNPVSRFLKKQWLQYMEIIGMAPFRGFSVDDLDFFVHRPPELRQRAAAKLLGFHDLVVSEMPEDFRKKFSRSQVGTLFDHKPAWIAIQRDDLPKPQMQCNFTLEVNHDGVCAHAVIRNGRHDSAKTPINTLYKFICAQPADFLQLLRGLGPDFYLRISARRGHAGGRPLPGADLWHPIAKISLDALCETTPAYVADLLRTIPYPGVHVGTSWARGEAILMKPDELASDVAQALGSLSEVLKVVH